MNTCPGALNIKGEHIPCDLDPPHPGLAHSNKPAEAIWTDDGDALRAVWNSVETAGR